MIVFQTIKKIKAKIKCLPINNSQTLKYWYRHEIWSMLTVSLSSISLNWNSIQFIRFTFIKISCKSNFQTLSFPWIYLQWIFRVFRNLRIWARNLRETCKHRTFSLNQNMDLHWKLSMWYNKFHWTSSRHLIYIFRRKTKNRLALILAYIIEETLYVTESI